MEKVIVQNNQKGIRLDVFITEKKENLVQKRNQDLKKRKKQHG